MIIKPLQLPLSIKKLQAILRRLSIDHPKRPMIEKELAQRMKGYRGELSLDFYLQHLPPKDYLILHDIRLSGRFSDFQMDILVLSPFFLLNLEVKNISGSLLFDETHQQLIRSIEGKEEGFSYPLIQIKRQEQLFKEWLSHNRFSPASAHIFSSYQQSQNYFSHKRVFHGKQNDNQKCSPPGKDNLLESNPH